MLPMFCPANLDVVEASQRIRAAISVACGRSRTRLMQLVESVSFDRSFGEETLSDECFVAASVVVGQKKMALAASHDDQRGLLSRRGIDRRSRLLNWQMMPKRDRGLPLRGRPHELLRPRALGIAFPLSSFHLQPYRLS